MGFAFFNLFNFLFPAEIYKKTTAKKKKEMAASKRKQDKTSGHPVASKKPKFGKESDKSKSASKKDVEFKKSKKPAKPVPKRTALSVESDSDELDDDDEALKEIKDDGSEGEEEVVEDGMDIDEVSKENGDGQSGCEFRPDIQRLLPRCD